IVPLETGTLAWKDAPEPVDLNGDYEPDDVSGDGVVFLGDPDDPDDVAQLTPQQQAAWDGLSDLAWVVQLFPRDNWPIPSRDARLDDTDDTKAEDQSPVTLADWPSFWTRAPQLVDFPAGNEKALSVSDRNGGDDLFVVVRPSENMKAHSEFRALVPAKLPSRTPENTVFAGVQIMPRAYSVVDTETKRSPEEGAVQDFYGHDMLAADVYARVLDATSSMQQSSGGPVIQPGGLEAAVLGVDMSANRPENVVARGTTGQPAGNNFTVADADVRTNPDAPGYYNNGWSNQVIGCYLIGLSQGDLAAARVEAYQITGVNGRQLQLRAGAPRGDRPWYVVKDPSFLEELTVEFYDVGNSGKFDLINDFLPLSVEDPVNGQFSGVALYRDNDWHPLNRNGVFDPPVRDANGNITEYIDLPLRLDGPPVFIGTVGGEPEYQVRFSFAKPGTDNLVGRNTVAYETQDRNRQWIPNNIGLSPSDPDYGPDFFVVVRASTRMSQGDQFQAGIVSWGPNTPTEPDPDNFMPALNSGALQIPPDQFDIFSEFPWGNRGLGVITLFQNPLPVYYWGYDKLTHRVVPRQDVDRSQEGADFAALRNWLRTNPYIWGRSATVTSLAPPQIDFVGVPTRQRVGGDVAFTLTGAVQVAQVLWDFGDGTTSTELNPVHQYAAEGTYTVTVTVTSVYGVNTTVRKVDYIEILGTPYADFSGTPTRGNITPGTPQPNLNVTFSDGSVAGEGCQIVSWFWNFGDGSTSTEQNPSHQYTTPGIYDVTLQVTFQCGTETIVRTLRRTAYVTVLECIGCDDPGGGGGGGGGTDVPAADITFESKVRDQEALLPLSDWVPLFRFTMSYGEEPENFAPRVLRTLTYLLRADDRDSNELGYMNSSGPHPTDLLEFGLFLESKASEEAEATYERTLNGELDPYFDRLLFTWDNTGAPVGSILTVQDRFGVAYRLDFIGNGTAANPQFRVDAGPNTEDSLEGKSYIVAVRTSATWRSQLTMGVEVLNAEMIDPRTGGRPVDEEGKPIDSYSPDFFGDTPETLEAEAFYSSSFTVYDYYGTPEGRSVLFADAWNFPVFLYTPLNEQSRPRWNSPNQLLDIVAGELLQLRPLVSLDQWQSVLGINVHSTSTVHFNDSEVP
ncbi:MAG TPA: PKD domain-containing protein, partial [Candidatus Hydrogenedentes bacterium]|nr:PKD domain-containing protein [Candidatus Hydrogenedentota bacterium]